MWKKNSDTSAVQDEVKQKALIQVKDNMKRNKKLWYKCRTMLGKMNPYVKLTVLIESAGQCKECKEKQNPVWEKMNRQKKKEKKQTSSHV